MERLLIRSHGPLELWLHRSALTFRWVILDTRTNRNLLVAYNRTLAWSEWHRLTDA